MTSPGAGRGARPGTTGDWFSTSAALMGGLVSVHLRPGTQLPPIAAARASRRVLALIATWAGRLTRFDGSSELSRLNAEMAGRVAVGPTLSAVLDWGREAETITDGVVDIGLLEARLVAETGATPRLLTTSRASRSWSLARHGRGSTVERPVGLRFDLDGIAKGWLADRALDLLPGVTAVVDADGDVAVRVVGDDACAIGVADPREYGSLLATVRLTGGAGPVARYGIATSGTSVHRWSRAGGPRHHLIDPGTGLPARTDVDPGDRDRRHGSGRRGVREDGGHRRLRGGGGAPRPPRGAGPDPRPGGRRRPRDAGHDGVPVMTFRGFDPRTGLARWGLSAIAVGIVMGSTAPGVLRDLGILWEAHRASLPWFLERLAAFLAYLAMTGSVVYGLLLSTKLLDAIAHRPISFALHQDLAAVGLGLAGVHGALLGLDSSVPFSIRQLVVPGLAPYAPLQVAIGQLTFYVTAVVVASFYVRRRIGQRTWRTIHLLTFLAFAGATAHGVLAGTDSGAVWTWWMYSLAVAIVVFLFAYRLVTASARRRDSARQQVLRPETEQVAAPREFERHLPPADRPAQLGRRVEAGEQVGRGFG